MEEGIYVIVEAGWEYNDEYYHRPECDGGTPKFWFKASEKALAEQETDRLNETARRQADPREYDVRDMDDVDFYKLVFVPYHGPLPKFAKGQTVKFTTSTRGSTIIGTVDLVRAHRGVQTYSIEGADGVLYSPISESDMSST